MFSLIEKCFRLIYHFRQIKQVKVRKKDSQKTLFLKQTYPKYNFGFSTAFSFLIFELCFLEPSHLHVNGVILMDGING